MSRRAKALRRPPRDRTSRANTSPRPRRSWSRGASAPRSLVRTGTARGRGNGLRRRGGRRSPAIDEDALHLPRRRAAAASATWQYLLLETSRKLVWTVPASARDRVYGPSAALLLGPAGSLGFPGFRRHSEPHEKCDRSESWGRSGGGDRSRRSSRRKRSGWCGRVARASARWRVSSI